MMKKEVSVMSGRVRTLVPCGAILKMDIDVRERLISLDDISPQVSRQISERVK